MLPLDNQGPAATERRPAAVAFGPFTFDRVSRLLRRGGVEIPLPPRVLGVLDELIGRAGEVISRQALIDSVWREAFVTDTSLAEAVSFLRQALGDDPQAPQFVQTVHRRGYRFVAAVTPVPSAPGPAPVSGATPEPVLRPAEMAWPSIGGHLVPWSLAAIALGLAVASTWQLIRMRPLEPAVVRMPVSPVAGTAFDPRGPALAVSPDGTTLAWSGCDESGCRLYVRGLDRLDPSALSGTEDAAAPFFSPDGRWVGFFAGGALRKVTVAGASPVTIADAPQALGGAWLADGRIVFAQSAHAGLFVVSEHGGPVAPLTVPSVARGEVGHAWPAALTGGAIVFSIATSPGGGPGRIALLPPGSRPATDWRILVENATVARCVGGDYLVYGRGSEILAVPLDTVRFVPAGAEQAVVSGVAPAQFAVSAGGTLFHASATGRPEASTSWLEPGVTTPLPGHAAALRSPALSPDGRSIAGIGGGNGTGTDVWIAEAGRGAATRLTHDGLNARPVWSPDGRTVFYSRSTGGAFGIVARDVTGSSAQSRLVLAQEDRHHFPASVSAQGQLVYVTSGGETRGDIWVASSAGTAAAAVVASPFDEVAGMLSPDGSLLAYQSDASGRWEIYLLRLADRHQLPLSAGGGVAPFWASDGRSVFFTAGPRLVKVEILDGGERAGHASEIARIPGAVAAGLSPDGRVLASALPMATTRAVATVQWIRELRRALGPPEAMLPR